MPSKVEQISNLKSQISNLVVIVGPTAVGKTALAIELAQRFDGEIVSADSRQIYRGMDIGTAKPTRQEQALVPHHLIDVVAPDEPYTLANYQAQAYAAIEGILARGKQPFLVGGTGLYIRAVVEGLHIPRVPPNKKLRAQLALEDGAALYERLCVLGPDAAARIDPRNVRRTIRALEVCLTTGRKFSELGRAYTSAPSSKGCASRASRQTKNCVHSWRWKTARRSMNVSARSTRTRRPGLTRATSAAPSAPWKSA